MKIVALILIAVGLVGLAFGTISYTTKEKVVDIGPVDISKEKTHSQAIPLGASLAALAAGAIMRGVAGKARA